MEESPPEADPCTAVGWLQDDQGLVQLSEGDHPMRFCWRLMTGSRARGHAGLPCNLQQASSHQVSPCTCQRWFDADDLANETKPIILMDTGPHHLSMCRILPGDPAPARSVIGSLPSWGPPFSTMR